MSLLLARGLRLGGIQTFPAPLDFLVTLQWWLHPAEFSPNPIPAFIQVHLPFFPLSPWGHKSSPELLPCALGLGCECNPAGGSACVSIDCLRKGRPSVGEEVPCPTREPDLVP